MSWFLIYRTAAYKSLTSSINKTSKKVESIKGTAGGREEEVLGLSPWGLQAQGEWGWSQQGQEQED